MKSKELLSNQIKSILNEKDKLIIADCDIAGFDIKDNEKERILELYRLYEFSDKVQALLSDTNYGTLFNYVKTGLISKEEMVQAILE